MKYGLLLVLLAFLGCSKDTTPNVPTSALKGKWIEVETRTDTLSFELMGDMEIMNLNRGKRNQRWEFVAKVQFRTLQLRTESRTNSLKLARI